MLNDQVIEQLTEEIIRRIERVNTFTLKKIGEVLAEIGDIPPSRAYDLAMILKYGGDYDKIVKELAKITNLNEKEILEIFEKVAKKNLAFAQQFYEYRGIDYIPYEKNIALQEQVRAIAKITQDTYRNLSNTLGFVKIKNGKKVFTPLAQAYQEAIDDSVTALIQGKEAFNSAMTKAVRELSASGIKTIEWESGYHRRLDSSVRMNLRGALRDFSMTLQQQFGEEFGADGVEISVHENPAPDHAEVQGHQFSINKYDDNGNLIEKGEFEKLQENGVAKDYKDKVIDIHRQLKNGDLTDDYRPIGQLNCYHYIFNVVLGVSKPLYTDSKLKEINDKNEKGFKLDGKHYTNYQGLQLQRKLETAIRKQKDRQIMAKASKDEEEELLATQKLTYLTNKYFELCKKSGLRSKVERLNFLRK